MICLSPRKSVGRSQHLPNQPSYGKPRPRGDALKPAGARAFQRTIGEGLKLPNEQPKKWRLWLNDEGWRKHYNAASFCPSLYKSLIQIGLAADLVVLRGAIGDCGHGRRDALRLRLGAWTA